MSRAFVKEDGPDTEPLPDLPLSPHPNYVTPRGLQALRERLAATQAELLRLKARADRLDRLPEKAAERDIRYVEARLASAIPVDPATQPQGEVAFATCVTVADEEGRETAYEIVGEDEADATRNRIAPQSPLARALLGARVGDWVEWRRPAGTVALEVIAIAPLPC
ncbi:MAG: GreA/GreB family elongation factor [Rhodobacteraceae bacterium]|jgi:transcription elongation GreA/GreB family factor|uniref:GreA/GreB family elongation factor n=1 Tax=Albidovulum sp. TaxID=1872424 RepID=UPI001E0C4B57|nr:GreA/GreB family elongation factor [uncultured Defluviimonas sp.]MCB2126883.1 GreA/GreB family elongation factor [Paracoccaceae bacterium]MCC0069754.1 GreA/GreB family elongation factor [Paracoccaceae bacterium]